jgi:hypothetical protein
LLERAHLDTYRTGTVMMSSHVVCSRPLSPDSNSLQAHAHALPRELLRRRASNRNARNKSTTTPRVGMWPPPAGPKRASRTAMLPRPMNGAGCVCCVCRLHTRFVVIPSSCQFYRTSTCTEGSFGFLATTHRKRAHLLSSTPTALHAPGKSFLCTSFFTSFFPGKIISSVEIRWADHTDISSLFPQILLNVGSFSPYFFLKKTKV